MTREAAQRARHRAGAAAPGRAAPATADRAGADNRRMQLLFCAAGSHGDVLPFIALARECRARGHDAVLLANPVFAAHATAAGVPLEPVGTAEGYRALFSQAPEQDPKAAFARVVAEWLALAPQYLAALRRLRRAGEAAIGVGPPLLYAPLVWRELDGVPCATVHLAPAALRSVLAPPQLGARGPGPGTPAWLMRAWWWAADRWYDRHLTEPLNRWRATLGLAPRRHAVGWADTADVLLGAFPAWFAPPAADWPPALALTGFLLADGGDAGGALEPGLEDFLAAGPAPVVFSAGTATFSARRFFEVSAEACRRSGRRGLLMSTTPEQLPGALPPGVRAVRYAPFGALLPRAAAFVHHGGVGSTAQALRAGVPQLVRPVAYDQFDNAARAIALGVALECTPRRYDAATAAAALDRLCGEAVWRERAAAVAARLHTPAESGAAAIARACDRLLAAAGG